MARFDEHGGAASRRTRPAYLLIEVALIVLGVMAGLMGNQLREEAALRKQSDKALGYIAVEMRTNLRQIEGVIEKHQALSDSLSALARQLDQLGRPANLGDLFKLAPQGFGAVLMQRSAWDLANQTGAVANMDYDLSSELAAAYRLQEFYQGKMNKIEDNIYIAQNMNPDNAAGLIYATSVLITDITFQEKKLVDRLGKLLDHLPVEEESP